MMKAAVRYPMLWLISRAEPDVAVNETLPGGVADSGRVRSRLVPED